MLHQLSQNIYRVLKKLDFWVNSFPTSGGSNIEMAILGKPTIDIAINRNLDLHPAEFLRFNECIVISLEEFISLGSNLIEKKDYRNNIGAALKSQISREFNKEKLVYERIYKELLKEYIRRAEGKKRIPEIKIEPTLDYEKRISLYNAYGRKNWSLEYKEEWLKQCIKEYPENTFAWIKLLEESILAFNFQKFKFLENQINKLQNPDYRLKVYLSKGYEKFNKKLEALDQIKTVLDSIDLDPIPIRLACRLYLAVGDTENAVNTLKRIKPESTIENIEKIVNEEPFDNIPFYYNY